MATEGTTMAPSSAADKHASFKERGDSLRYDHASLPDDHVEEAADEAEEPKKQRRCFPRLKKKQDRNFHILCGVGALVFGTLILGIPSYVVLNSAIKSGINKEGKWEGFPEKEADLEKQKFYQHTKDTAFQFGCLLAAISGVFVLLGVIVISFNACCVKLLPDVQLDKSQEVVSPSALMHLHHGTCDMEVQSRRSKLSKNANQKTKRNNK